MCQPKTPLASLEHPYHHLQSTHFKLNSGFISLLEPVTEPQGRCACWFLVKDAAEIPDERMPRAGACGKGRVSHAPPDCTPLQNPPCTLLSGSCQNLAFCVFIETSLHKRDWSCNPSTGLHAEGLASGSHWLTSLGNQTCTHFFFCAYLHKPVHTCEHKTPKYTYYLRSAVVFCAFQRICSSCPFGKFVQMSMH